MVQCIFFPGGVIPLTFLPPPQSLIFRYYYHGGHTYNIIDNIMARCPGFRRYNNNNNNDNTRSVKEHILYDLLHRNTLQYYHYVNIKCTKI